MTRTKWLRRALLGGAALSVMATGAQADELAALKAQLEALQARVSEIETQPAPALPAGASLLSVRRGQLSSSQILPLRASDRLYETESQGYTISVTPTADMPAPVSEVTVSGVIRALFLYSDNDNRFLDDGFIDNDYNGFDIQARGRLTVEGKTETAVGEVGGTMRLQGLYDGDHDQDDKEDVDMDIAWGYWQMTPNFQLGGGYAGDAGTLLAGVDNQHTNDVTGGVNAFSNTDNEQIRLTYTNGGITLGIAVEDNDAEYSSTDHEAEGDIPAITGYATFDTGSFIIAAAANYVVDERAYDGDALVGYDSGDASCGFTAPSGINKCNDDWSAGIGINGTLGDMFSFTVAVAAGQGNAIEGLSSRSMNVGADDDWWGVTGGVIFSFATAMQLQLGAGYGESSDDHDDQDPLTADGDETIFDATAVLFWDPVDQLTLSVGGGYHDNAANAVGGNADPEYWVAGFGAYFRF